MADAFPDFRGGNVLATRFTGTRSERYGAPVERLPTPGRLGDWLALNGLAVASCSSAELDLARQLREAVHVAATAVATGAAVPAAAIRVLNERSAQGAAAAALTRDGGREWRLGPEPCVADALSVVAADAIGILSGERDGRLACAPHRPAARRSWTPARAAPAGGAT